MNGGGPVDSAGIARRVARLFERIETACHRGGRNLREVTLVAASKTMPVEAIRAAAEAGVAVFGENRVQEAIRKIEALPGLHWHYDRHSPAQQSPQGPMTCSAGDDPFGGFPGTGIDAGTAGKRTSSAG